MTLKHKDIVKGRAVYVLVLIVVLNALHPMTSNGNSLTTQSTAGYGDVSPVNPWARMLSGLEATIGVLYVAILVARLVSLYEVRRRIPK